MASARPSSSSSRDEAPVVEIVERLRAMREKEESALSLLLSGDQALLHRCVKPKRRKVVVLCKVNRLV